MRVSVPEGWQVPDVPRGFAWRRIMTSRKNPYSMPLNIKNPEADELARRLAKKTGRRITDVIIYALREQFPSRRG